MAQGSEVRLVRHAESEANGTNRWEGRTDGVLTPREVEQIEVLARRVRAMRFDLVVSSSLHRARHTAATFGDHDIDHDLIEVDLGGWEGLPIHEVIKSHRADLDNVLARFDVPFGRSGETRTEIAIRLDAAIKRVFSALGPNQKAVVVTHGGVLDAITDRTFGRDQGGRRLGSFTANTGMTKLVERFGRYRLASFNDTGHLGRGRPRLRRLEPTGLGSSPLYVTLAPLPMSRDAGMVLPIGDSMMSVFVRPGLWHIGMELLTVWSALGSDALIRPPRQCTLRQRLWKDWRNWVSANGKV